MAEKSKPKTPNKPMTAKEQSSMVASVIQSVTGPWTSENGVSWLKLIVFVFTVWWLLIQPFRIPSGSMEPTLHGDPGFFTGDRVFVNKLAFGIHIPFTGIHLLDWSEPKRWDIVVFRTVEPPDPPPTNVFGKALNAVLPKVLIKRVAGLPGDRVHIAGGKVYINGVAQTLPDGMPDVYYSQSPMSSTDELDEFMKNAPPDQLQARIESLKAQIPSRLQYFYGVLPTDEYSVVPPGHYLMLGDNSSHSQDGRYFGWVPKEHLLGRAFCIWWPISRHRDLTGFTHTWWGLALLIGIPLVLVGIEISRAFFILPWRVKSASAPGTLRPGERVWIDRTALGIRLPFSEKRLGFSRIAAGDLVAYAAPNDTNGVTDVYFGHVAAAPGASVSVENGEIKANGRIVGISGSTVKPADWLARKKTTVPENHYLILADPGSGAPDSRTLGPLAQDNVLGTVVTVWWPPHRIRSTKKVDRKA